MKHITGHCAKLVTSRTRISIRCWLCIFLGWACQDNSVKIGDPVQTSFFLTYSVFLPTRLGKVGKRGGGLGAPLVYVLALPRHCTNQDNHDLFTIEVFFLTETRSNRQWNIAILPVQRRWVTALGKSRKFCQGIRRLVSNWIVSIGS